MKTRYYQYAVIAIAAMLLMACNGIETVGLDADSVISKHKTSLIRDVNVTQNEAIGIANMFAHSNAGSDNPQTKGAFSSTKMISSSETIREDGQNLMYVFNYEGGGFVIVGSTRNYYPILAYSDEGSFILKEDMGPIVIWLDEVKENIKNSSYLSEDTKAQMRNLWLRYEGTYDNPTQELMATRRPQTRNAGEDSCWARCDSLFDVHGVDGWVFCPLSYAESLFDELGYGDEYDEICYYAGQNHSEPNETLIGYNTQTVVDQVGPLLVTNWYQRSPFGDSCSNLMAGCGAVAAGQLMYFYHFPDSLTWKGETFGWNKIPASPSWHSFHRQPEMMRMLGQKFNMDYRLYPDSISVTTDYNLKKGLDSLGFYTSIANHNYFAVKDELFDNNRPVIMSGKDPTHTTGHIWVCDGVRETTINEIRYFTENQPYGTGTFTQGQYSINSPGSVGGNVYIHFYMNWGHGTTGGNAWYLGDNVNSHDGNYQNFRKDIFVEVP